MKTARCWNPECKYTMQVHHGGEVPKTCPVCGYGDSEADQERHLKKIMRALRWKKWKTNWFGLKFVARWMLSGVRGINTDKWIFDTMVVRVKKD